MYGFAQPIPKGSIPMRTPDPYDPSTRPHHLSSPLARFQTFSGLSPTASTPLANVLYEARLEATHDPIALPVILHMAPGGSCLALLSMGGYMNRDPRLEYILFDQDTQSRNFRFPTEQSLQLPFTEAATRCAIDEERKLIFTADEERIKSFAWGDYSDRSAAGTIFKEPLPVHTLNTWSPEAKGPIALRGDRILRSGTDVILAWNIDDLDQHEPGSEASLGGEFPIDSDDEDADDIEPSAGNKFHNLVKLKTKNFSIGEWHPYPSASGNMLAGADHYYRQSSVLTACYALDLETGDVATKYIGHGGPVGTFSTSAGDPNVFLTGCDDGYVRLYDTRQPLPILTVDVSSLHDPCSSALFVHPDGVPTIFTGSEKAQNIKLWDVRARAVVYELATGNNAVISMVWDDTRNALYAATECEYLTSYMSHESYNKDYRRATIPKWQTEKVPTILKSSTREAGPSGVNRDAAEDPTGDDTDWVDEDDSYDGEEDEDDFEYGGGRRWPKQAEHAEDYFGHTFDASQHRVYRFAFKADANPDILPGFGTFDY
ncbi:hypothetical protein HYDPIDRAFT_26162 [Hydnomerulius pinastri MD-312]|nr:hypothetical protein HYDPIDRAFT_26162 [Hydnomerulius pinastri MD-312]